MNIQNNDKAPAKLVSFYKVNFTGIDEVSGYMPMAAANEDEAKKAALEYLTQSNLKNVTIVSVELVSAADAADENFQQPEKKVLN